mgnify:CR=1 FL=1
MRSPGAKKEDGPSGKPLSYVNGFLLQFLNVHILMLGIAAYSGYILPHGYTVPAVLCFSVIMAACAATGNRSDADDVFQEVFLRYHRSAPEFASEAHEKAWLLRVTANRTRSLLASPWRRRSVPLEDVYACSGRRNPPWQKLWRPAARRPDCCTCTITRLPD